MGTPSSPSPDLPRLIPTDSETNRFCRGTCGQIRGRGNFGKFCYCVLSHQPSGRPGGLGVVLVNQPLSLPSPRASDPVPLEVSRANIVFAKVYDELSSESLQKCAGN